MFWRKAWGERGRKKERRGWKGREGVHAHSVHTSLAELSLPLLSIREQPGVKLQVSNPHNFGLMWAMIR
jgi:hypothetical protein